MKRTKEIKELVKRAEYVFSTAHVDLLCAAPMTPPERTTALLEMAKPIVKAWYALPIEQRAFDFSKEEQFTFENLGGFVRDAERK